MTGSPDTTELRRPGLVLAGLAFVAITIMAQLYGPIALLPEIATRYGTGIREAAWVISTFGFSLAAGFLLFGRLSDIFGRRFCMVTGLTGTCAASIAIGFTDDFDMILILRVFQGFFTAGYPPSAIAWLQERLPDRMKFTGVSVFTGSLLLAGIAGQVFAGLGGFGGTPRMIVLLPAAVLFLAAIVILFRLPGGVAGRQVSSVRIRDFPFLRLWAIFFGSAMSLVPFVMFFAAVEISAAAGQLDVDPMTVRYLGVPGLLATGLAGMALKRYGSMSVMLAGFCLMGASFLPPLILTPEDGVLVTGVGFTFGVALAVPALLSLVGGAVPDARAFAISFHACVQFIGVALAPAATEWLLALGSGVEGVAAVAAVLSFCVLAVNWRAFGSRV